MPVIPRFQTAGSVRTAGAGVNAGAAGAVGAAMQGLGQTVAGFAEDAIRRKKEADNAAFMSDSFNKLSLSWTEKLQNAETTGAEVDLKALQQSYNDEVSTLLESAPTEEARNAFKMKADSTYAGKFFPQFAAHQSRMNVRKRVNATTSALDNIVSEVVTGRTSVSEAWGRADSAITGLAETSAGAVDIEKLRENTLHSIGSSAIGAMITGGKASQALREMKEGKWDEFTSASDLARLTNAAKREMDAQAARAMAEYSAGLDDYMAFVSSGRDNADLSAKFSREKLVSVYGAEKGAKIADQVEDARAFGQAFDAVKTASPEELAAIREQNKPAGPDDFRRESAQFNAIERAIIERNKQLADDPAGYLSANVDSIKPVVDNFVQSVSSGDPAAMAQSASVMADTMREELQRIGIPPRSVAILPKQVEQMIANQLNDFSQGGEQAATVLNTYKDAFGADWPAVMNQLQANKSVSASMRVLSSMPAGRNQNVLSEAYAIGGKALKEAAGDDVSKAITDESAGLLEDFQETLRGQPGGVGAYNDFKGAVETLALKYIVDGTTDSVSDALESAADAVINDQFAFVGSYRVPTKYNAERVARSAEQMIIDVKGGAYDLMVPPSINVQNREDAAEVYRRALNPKIMTAPDGSGLMVTHSDGSVIIKADGSPLVVPFEDLDNNAPSLGLFGEQL